MSRMRKHSTEYMNGNFHVIIAPKIDEIAQLVCLVS